MYRLHILIGSNDDFEVFHNAVDKGATTRWIVPKSAEPDDSVLLFFVSEDSAICGTAIIDDEPQAEDPGRYLSTLRSPKLLERPISAAKLAKQFPDWGWPTSPRAYTTVPEEIVEPLMALLKVDLEAELTAAPGIKPFNPANPSEGRQHIRSTIAARQGQGPFRERLLDAYGSRCAISGCSVQAVLDAAHILPYKDKDTNQVQNGLLLRSDLHTLFDQHRLGIDPTTMTVVVDSSIADRCYRVLDRKTLRLPDDPQQHPNKVSLRKHFKRCSAR